jgi:hypothetical protein
MIPKLGGACYAVRWVVHISNITTFKSIYFAYFHSVIKYGIIFWGNSSNSGKIFTLQKKTVRIMVVAKPRTSCWSLFKKSEILLVQCQYVFSLMTLIVNNQEYFQTNLSVHSINTRNKHHLHRPIANLTCFHKGAFCAGIKIFSSLPHNRDSLRNDKAQFKVVLRRYST